MRKQHKEGSVIVPLPIETEMARKELGYSPTEFYELPGISMWKEPTQKIPYSQSEIIAIHRLIKLTEAIDNDMYMRSKGDGKPK